MVGNEGMSPPIASGYTLVEAPGNPLFGSKDYPLISTVDALIALSKSVESHPFGFLLWTEDKKGFHKYHEGRSVTGLSPK